MLMFSLPRSDKPRSSRVAFGMCASALAVTGAVALAVTGLNSDAVIATGFETAFANVNMPTSIRSAPKPYDGIAGTEEFWLRTPTNDLALKAVAVGGEITLSMAGSERRMTILTVREAGETETHIDTASSPAPVLLLTCREGDPHTGREIRLRLQGSRIVEVPADLMPRSL